jgi:hypothetical protein
MEGEYEKKKRMEGEYEKKRMEGEYEKKIGWKVNIKKRMEGEYKKNI